MKTAFSTTPHSTEHDTKLDKRIVLAGLWTAMLFIFAYVDIFGFWRADVINGVLSGTVSGTNQGIDQAFLVFTTLFVAVPSLTIVVCLLAPLRANRVTNLIVSVLCMVVIVVAMIGETWIYCILGSLIELGLLAAIASLAWAWRTPTKVSRSSALEPKIGR